MLRGVVLARLAIVVSVGAVLTAEVTPARGLAPPNTSTAPPGSVVGWGSQVDLDSERPEGRKYPAYHFKEERLLTLDVTRVAVLKTSSAHDPVATPNEWAEYGLDVSATHPMVVPGWSFIATNAAHRTATGVAGAVSQIAGREPVEFVSPVFVDGKGGPIVITPDILVGFDRSLDPARAEAILAESGAGAILDRDWANMKRTYRLKSASRDGFAVLEAANELAQRPEVIFAEPDMMVTAYTALIPNDTYFPNLWGLHNDGTFSTKVSCTVPDFDMDVPEAWDITIGDPSVIVAILDTGVQLDHPDLNLYTPGFDATGEGGGGGPVNACDNHGTPVAGCVSGIINNNLGIVGVAPGVKSASARIGISNLSCDNSFTTTSSWVVNSLAWAESIGARITNNSWGYFSGQIPSAVALKFQQTRDAGIVHFAAAGNSTSDVILDPAALPSVNAVAALDPCEHRASFSNWGEGLAFSAPGHYIISTDRTGVDGYNDGILDGACVPDGLPGCSSDTDCAIGQSCFLVSTDYALVVGTSFATPYTAGVAALLLSADSDLSADQVEGILQQSAVDLDPAGYDTEYGWGFVNAYDALLLDLACMGVAPPQEELVPTTKNRYLSLDTSYITGTVALRVTAVDLPAPFDVYNNMQMWVDAPAVYRESATRGTEFLGSSVSCTPTYLDWSTIGVVHVYGAMFVPGGTYQVRAILEGCDPGIALYYSVPLVLETRAPWGDIVAPFGAEGGAAQPDFKDIASVVSKFVDEPTAPLQMAADLEPAVANQTVDFKDIAAVVSAFMGAPYALDPPVACP